MVVFFHTGGIWGAGDFYGPRGGGQQTEQRSVHKAGGEPPATGMARDYDYLFKLLIIGDSGKATPGMRDGKWALCFFFFFFLYMRGSRNATPGSLCSYLTRFTTCLFLLCACK